MLVFLNSSVVVLCKLSIIIVLDIVVLGMLIWVLVMISGELMVIFLFLLYLMNIV